MSSLEVTATVLKNSQNVFEDAAIVPKNSQNVFEDAATVPKNSQNVFEDAATVLKNSQNIFEDAATVPENSQNVFEDAATVPENSQNVFEDAATIPKNSQNVFEDAATIPKNGQNLFEYAATLSEDALKYNVELLDHLFVNDQIVSIIPYNPSVYKTYEDYARANYKYVKELAQSNVKVRKNLIIVDRDCFKDLTEILIKWTDQIEKRKKMSFKCGEHYKKIIFERLRKTIENLHGVVDYTKDIIIEKFRRKNQVSESELWSKKFFNESVYTSMYNNFLYDYYNKRSNWCYNILSSETDEVIVSLRRKTLLFINGKGHPGIIIFTFMNDLDIERSTTWSKSESKRTLILTKVLKSFYNILDTGEKYLLRLYIYEELCRNQGSFRGLYPELKIMWNFLEEERESERRESFRLYLSKCIHEYKWRISKSERKKLLKMHSSEYKQKYKERINKYEIDINDFLYIPTPTIPCKDTDTRKKTEYNNLEDGQESKVNESIDPENSLGVEESEDAKKGNKKGVGVKKGNKKGVGVKKGNKLLKNDDDPGIDDLGDDHGIDDDLGDDHGIDDDLGDDHGIDVDYGYEFGDSRKEYNNFNPIYRKFYTLLDTNPNEMAQIRAGKVTRPKGVWIERKDIFADMKVFKRKLFKYVDELQNQWNLKKSVEMKKFKKWRFTLITDKWIDPLMVVPFSYWYATTADYRTDQRIFQCVTPGYIDPNTVILSYIEHRREDLANSSDSIYRRFKFLSNQLRSLSKNNVFLNFIYLRIMNLLLYWIIIFFRDWKMYSTKFLSSKWFSIIIRNKYWIPFLFLRYKTVLGNFNIRSYYDWNCYKYYNFPILNFEYLNPDLSDYLTEMGLNYFALDMMGTYSIGMSTFTEKQLESFSLSINFIRKKIKGYSL